MTRRLTVSLAVGAFLMASCNQTPREIEAVDDQESTSGGGRDLSRAGIFVPEPRVDEDLMNTEVHTVVALALLPAAKYVYIQVQEGSEEYWIATNKMDVQIGSQYMYTDALLKSNFQSREHDRTFDKLYLVSTLVPANHGTENPRPVARRGAEIDYDAGDDHQPTNALGAISIKELVENSAQYVGKLVKVSGKCTKINPNIMGRNWIHLKDGSMDDYDLVVTANVQIPVGHQITLEGTLQAERDFGSGYYYDLIIENGQLAN